MNISIRTKLFSMGIFLVLVTILGISIRYYVLTKQDKHRESRQRVQIAFDIILKDFIDRSARYIRRLENFLQENMYAGWAANSYNQDKEQVGSVPFIVGNLKRITEEIKKFGRVISANRVALYAADTRLLAIYQRHENQEMLGMYLVSQSGNDTYFSLDDPVQVSSVLFGDGFIPDVPLPPGIAAHYEGEIPDTASAALFSGGQQLGIRISAPVFFQEVHVGLLVSEFLYTQDTVEGYASLSKTDVSFFAGDQLSVGTFPAQSRLDPGAIEQMLSCEDIIKGDQKIAIMPVTFDDQGYYQGQCAFQDSRGTVGAITVSLSKEIERQEINKILKSVLIISVIMISIATGLLLLFSRRSIRSIHDIVEVIVAAAGGDLRQTVLRIPHDEIGMLASKLNQMIAQLRSISTQVQGAAYEVNSTADTILEQMHDLIGHMEQQSTSVDNTTSSVETITAFIDIVARNTADLLDAAAQILSSLQETRASIEEVTASTGSLTTNLYLISSSVEQANNSVKQIAESAGHLEDTAQQTETEIHHIDQLLQDVSHNADRTQQLAKETMDAATRGQSSVEASIQGMTELKTVVSDTAQIIKEVSSWGGQVSSILDIVDEITEQTALLALNASIISAQAGVHGRGFAVVADEIKELATRTKDSTKEIGTLVRELQKKTEEGVSNTAEGLRKADHGMQLASAVQEALNTILERATRSSNRAADTARVIQQTADSSQMISTSMSNVTEKVSHIRAAIQDQEKDMEQVAAAVENISGMAEQVNRSGIEQTKTTEQIAQRMADVTEQFNDVSDQTGKLKQNSQQIVDAMHTIELTTEQILQNATNISGDTVKNLIQQSKVLQKIVNFFKVS